jgi:hypothetical protein
VRDAVDAVACTSGAETDQCGLSSVDDGTCLFLFEVCTIGCDTNADCPTGTTCSDLLGLGVAYCLTSGILPTGF